MALGALDDLHRDVVAAMEPTDNRLDDLRAVVDDQRVGLAAMEPAEERPDDSRVSDAPFWVPVPQWSQPRIGWMARRPTRSGPRTTGRNGAQPTT